MDPFFYGRPSGIAAQLWTWITSGTAQGPLWLQVVTTLEEAFLGFLIGVGLGVIFGVTLGRVRLLADVFAPYIKALNAMPRVVLGSIFIITIVALSAEVLMTRLEGHVVRWRPNTITDVPI